MICMIHQTNYLHLFCEKGGWNMAHGNQNPVSSA